MKMKKVLMTVAAVALISAPALAEHHGGGPEGGHHKGKMFEAMDENGDGMVSKDEFMASHMKRFEKMDTNADGNVSKEEIEAHRAAKREKMKEKKMEAQEGQGEPAEGAE